MVIQRVRRSLTALAMLVFVLAALMFFQFTTKSWPFNEKVNLGKNNWEPKTEREQIDLALKNGDAETLFKFARDKKDYLQMSFVERVQTFRDRINVSERLLELPVDDYMLKMAKVANLRGLITEQCVYRNNAELPPERTDALANALEKFQDEDEPEIKKLVAAGSSFLSLSKLLDTPIEDVPDEWFTESGVELERAAKLNVDDFDIAITHFYFIDWLRSRFGDVKCGGLIKIMGKIYIKSGDSFIRQNTKGLLASFDERSG